MNVLGICGSPHPEGNTAFALRFALDIIAKEGIETTYISLAGQNISPALNQPKPAPNGQIICFILSMPRDIHCSP